jgi:hypothetical protein
MNNKAVALKAYASYLQHRLNQPVPPKHQGAPEAFKQMLEIDLKKTLAKIEDLSK